MTAPYDARREGTANWLADSGWRGALLIAATYVYFLIFAQFGFLKRLDQLGLSGAYLKPVMGAMAVGGILASVLGARYVLKRQPALRLRVAFGGCALMALATLAPLTVVSAVAIAAGIGLSLGLLTVTLVSTLALWTGKTNPLLAVGIGTGLGYFICNLPPLFNASPRGIALTAAVVCAGALLLPASGTEVGVSNNEQAGAALPFWLVLLWFTALIWFDSAAFFIIQNSPQLKSGTWGGDAHLWRNAALHLFAAIASVLLLRRKGLAAALATAFACLAGACLLLLRPGNAGPASLLYPVGVSLYSVALVAAPTLLLRSVSAEDRRRKAGWLYAVAGWIGSALGIGMAQNLHHVPVAFVGAAAMLFAVPLLLRLDRRNLAPVLSIALLAMISAALARTVLRGPAPPLHAAAPNLVARGRQVYISEGCIHCHSQYVRPHSADVVLWGPAQDVEVIRRQKPPLIGNRRQGPDLSEVGARRSPLWMRIHFLRPRDVSYASVMPSYSDLFADNRGDALIAYLQSLQTAGSVAHIRDEMGTWKATAPNGPLPNGGVLFAHYCATCHQPTGAARRKWSAAFSMLPPDLASTVPVDLAAVPDGQAREQRVESIVKFGMPGTDMPGHEYLLDREVITLARYVESLQAGAAKH